MIVFATDQNLVYFCTGVKGVEDDSMRILDTVHRRYVAHA